MKICEYCDSNCSDNAVVCPNCGGRFRITGKTCPRCKNTYSGSSCPECGYDSSKEGSNTASASDRGSLLTVKPTDDSATDKNEKTKRILAGVIGVVILLVVVVIASSVMKKKAQSNYLPSFPSDDVISAVADEDDNDYIFYDGGYLCVKTDDFTEAECRKMNAALSEFSARKQVGIYYVFTDNLDGDYSPSEGAVKKALEEMYDEYFTDENHILFVYIIGMDCYYYYCGDDALAALGTDSLEEQCRMLADTYGSPSDFAEEFIMVYTAE